MNPAPPAAVLVIGIDAANPDLLREWARQGSLPHIRTLLDRGLIAESMSLPGFYVGSTWPSLYTGTSPAKHGLHYLKQLIPGTYRFRRMSDGAFVQRAPVWGMLSRAGRRVAVLDVPLSRPDPGLNGLQVVEWGGHDAVFGFHTHPPEAATSIREKFGNHPAGSRCDAPRRGAEDYQRFIAALERGARLKGALTVDQLHQGGWDLVMQVFTESHCVGHQCWHLHDPTHPNHDPSIRSLTGDPLARVYTAIDAAVGEILTAAGDALVFLVVAHGMSYRFGASFLLPDILVRLGVSAPPPPESGGSPLFRLASSLWRVLPSGARRALSPIRGRFGGRAPARESPVLPPHLQASRCFPVNNGLAAGGIRLNLRGREPTGMLEPGPQAETFCTELARDLLAIVDDRTGQPLIRRVLRTRDFYQGEHLADLPDLLVEWSDAAATGVGGRVRIRSPRIGTMEGINTYGRTGEHRPEGLLVAAGKGIPAGRLPRPVSILDFSPTIAALFDVTLLDTDGEVIPEFVVPHVARRGEQV